jgi:hypothetical protein|nr:MAG TPA: hemolysin [Siphoviridae sp. ctKRf14]
MSDAVIVALLSLAGTLLGSLAGVMTSSKLINFRLEQLERKVQAHNNLVERMYGLEERVGIQEEKQKVANHRIDDLEKQN